MNKFKRSAFGVKFALVLVGFIIVSSVVADNHQESKSGVKVESIRDGLYMLQAKGGNVGVFIGEDGVFVIDDGYQEVGPAILSAIQTITPQPVSYLVNTHWHGDHTGGNEHIGKSGATIVAHDNVRALLKSGSRLEIFNTDYPGLPPVALPKITYNDAMTFHWNGDTVVLQHYANAHTNGDGVIFFEKANVVHTGDVFFNGFYPFIDAEHGGSIKGMIKAVDAILARSNDKTLIIPGHGPLSSKKELQNYREMLNKAVQLIEPLKKQGLSMAEVIERKPTQPLDAKWGKGFLSPDLWTRIVYNAL
ncbi:MBL fold metallo-hydrolase [Marinibactrum halimedae]|nr:MBL fold metallo-hydrolase [Marinibactrum halimedae]MCD9459384.1 MBL fold metallo-hydrolase [Marinibactrum halimedae]